MFTASQICENRGELRSHMLHVYRVDELKGRRRILAGKEAVFKKKKVA